MRMEIAQIAEFAPVNDLTNPTHGLVVRETTTGAETLIRVDRESLEKIVELSQRAEGIIQAAGREISAQETPHPEPDDVGTGLPFEDEEDDDPGEGGLQL